MRLISERHLRDHGGDHGGDQWGDRWLHRSIRGLMRWVREPGSVSPRNPIRTLGVAVWLMAAAHGVGCEEVSDVASVPDAGPEPMIVFEPLDDRRVDLGLQLLERGGYAEAQVAFERSLADHPDHPRRRWREHDATDR